MHPMARHQDEAVPPSLYTLPAIVLLADWGRVERSRRATYGLESSTELRKYANMGLCYRICAP